MNDDTFSKDRFQLDINYVESKYRTFFEGVRDQFVVESFNRRTFFSKLNRTDSVICFVRRGCVRVVEQQIILPKDEDIRDSLTTEAPRQKLIELLSAGMIFGDLCLREFKINSPIPRIQNANPYFCPAKSSKAKRPPMMNYAECEISALDVFADRHSEIWSIHSQKFLELVRKFPEIMIGVVQLWGRQQFIEQSYRVQMSTLDVSARLASLFLCLGDSYCWSRDYNGHPKIEFMTQQDLADLVGASRPFVSSHLNLFKNMGALNFLGRTISIADRSLLVKFIRDRQRYSRHQIIHTLM